MKLEVTCLQLSYGRPSLSVEAVECFLRQTYQHKKLIIINTHPSPIYFNKEYPNINVYNIKPLPHLSDVYRFGMDLIQSDYFCIWDDDDIFLPWHIKDRVDVAIQNSDLDMIGHEYAFYSETNEIKSMTRNMFVSQYLYKNNGWRPDPNICLWDISWDNYPWKKFHIKFPLKPSYIYRWGTGEMHMSGYGSKEDDAHRIYVINQTDKGKISLDFPWEPKWTKDYVHDADIKFKEFTGQWSTMNIPSIL